uniref:Coactosin-like protein n=1 Tax=Arion vulgaris TaxID=1028688 RepID=A0A0B6Z764_9EUPU
MTTIDKNSTLNAYDEVRADNSEIIWLTLKFSGQEIKLDKTGDDFEEFVHQFTDDERIFGYVRVVTGDELSKRAKFVFITWIGKDVSPIKKAKAGVDKTLVKNIIKNYALEVMAEDHEDIKLEALKNLLAKVGGANYGTGVSS